MMKNKHNKKRNTAFVFEALAREATVAIIKGDNERKAKVVSIVRKHFTGDSLLKKDLECYRSLYENQNLDETTSKKIVEAVMAAKRLIDPDWTVQAADRSHQRHQQGVEPSNLQQLRPQLQVSRNYRKDVQHELTQAGCNVGVKDCGRNDWGYRRAGRCSQSIASLTPHLPRSSTRSMVPPCSESRKNF